MPRDRFFAEVLEELQAAKKTGAYFINVKESSEDLIRIYIKTGELYALTYGSAVGQDAMDIIEYYSLQNATFFDGLAAPAGIVPLKVPMKKFIEMMRKAHKKVRVP